MLIMAMCIFFVSSWANDAAREQPSFLAGYELRADNPPRASVGSDRVMMYVAEREGFVEEPREEARLVNAMRRGATMRLEAVSARGTNTAYTFSLSGGGLPPSIRPTSFAAKGSLRCLALCGARMAFHEGCHARGRSLHWKRRPLNTP